MYILDCMSKGTFYCESRIEFQKVPIALYPGLNSKCACYCVSRIDQCQFKVLIAVYLKLNVKRYLLLCISDRILKGTRVTVYLGLYVKRYILLCISD